MMNDEYLWIWKVSIGDYFMELFRNSPTDTEGLQNRKADNAAEIRNSWLQSNV